MSAKTSYRKLPTSSKYCVWPDYFCNITAISDVYRELTEISRERQSSGEKRLIDIGCHRSKWGDRLETKEKAAGTQITTGYNQSLRDSVYELTTPATFKTQCTDAHRPLDKVPDDSVSS